MGMIILVVLGLNIGAILLLNCFLYWILNLFRKNISDNDSFFQIPTIFFTIPTIILSIIGSFLIFYHYFYAGSVGLGMAIWAPIIRNEIELGKIDSGTIILAEEIDRATGARGGLDIDFKLFLITPDQKKEIGLYQSSIYRNPTQYFSLRNNDTLFENGRQKPDSDYNLFIDPNIFAISEYYSVVKYLRDNIDSIDEKLKNDRFRTYKKLANYYSQNRFNRRNPKDPFPKFDNVYYFDRQLLNRTFTCDNAKITISLNGGVWIFFNNEVKRENGAILKNYPLGNIVNNGKHLLAWHNIKNFTVDSKKMTLFNTIVESCYDQNSADFFKEYTFSQEVIERKAY
jgi:hypothetical protein